MEHVVSVKYLGGHRLRLRFDDGVEGVVDFAKLLKFRGDLVAPLRDPAYFAKAFVHREARVVTWPNGMDVDNLVLYSKVTGRSIRSLLNPSVRRVAKAGRGRAAKV
jgi:hypothetical protein